MSPRTKQRVRQGGRVSKRVIAAQRATRAQIRAAQGEDELLEPPDDIVEAEGVVGMRPEVIQEVRIPAPDLQASDRSQSDSSSGPADNPSDSSGDSGGNESDDDDDDPSGISVGDQLAMAQVFIEFNGVLAEPQFREKLITFGLTPTQADIVIENGAVSAKSFARLFDKDALEKLFQYEGLTGLRVLVIQRIRVLHRWLRQQQEAGRNLGLVNLTKFDDDALASLLDQEEREGTTKGRSVGGAKDGLTLPTFNGNQISYKTFNIKWRAYLSNSRKEEG